MEGLKYLTLLKPIRFSLITSIVLDICLMLLQMFIPLLSVLLFDYAYPEKDTFVFTMVIAGGFYLFLLDQFFSSSVSFTKDFYKQHLSSLLEIKVFEKIIKLSAKEQWCQNKEAIKSLLTSTVSKSSDIFIETFFIVPGNCLQILFFFGVFFFVNPKIALLAALLIPLYALERRFFVNQLDKAYEPIEGKNKSIRDFLNEKLSNLNAIKAFHRERDEVRQLQNYYSDRRVYENKYNVLSLFSGFTIENIIQVWMTLIIGFMGYQVILGKMSFGQLIALTAYLPLIEGPIKKLANFYVDFLTGVFYKQTIGNFLNMPEEKYFGEKEEFPSIQKSVLKGEISLKSISMAYDSSCPVLETLDLAIPPCSSVAVVGESGVGKTSLLNLLNSFYKPSDGMVLIDGKDVQSISLEQLRSQIGVVFQNITLFNKTIRENILYGNPNATEKDLIETAKMAVVHDYIAQLPKGYDTLVDNLGETLPGGFKQRIAMARALLLKPKILILDEATSALDAESEFLIKETLQRCKKQMTIVMVAHRFSMIKSFDQILVLEKGRIAEKGTFAELMKKRGLFFKLYHLQYGGLEEFKRRLEIEFQRNLRYAQEISLLIFEMNKKEYDEILNKHGATFLNRFMEEFEFFAHKNIRIMDFSSMLHLNRIVLGLPETTSANARLTGNRLKEKIENNVFEINGETFKITVSHGIAALTETKPAYAEELIDKALEDLKLQQESLKDQELSKEKDKTSKAA